MPISMPAHRRIDRHPLDARRARRTFRPMNTRIRATSESPGSTPSLKFSLVNAVLLAAGLAAITAGYVLLARGSVVAAPLLLVLGYAVLLPLAIIL
jgi:hypothetical protein